MQSFKSFINIFLSVAMLVATNGFTLHKHYCMGRLKAVSINQSASPCAEKGLPAEMPCCEDMAETLKVEEITEVSFDFEASPCLLELGGLLGFFSPALHLTPQQIVGAPNHYPPPPIQPSDIQAVHQVFLI